MRNATTLCLLLTLLVACGDGPPTKPPARAPQSKTQTPTEPEPTSVVVEVEATLPGASTVEMEQLAALPLERALSVVEGVERTTTTCTKGQCVVRLTLRAGIEVTEVRERLQTALRGLKELSKDGHVLLRPLQTEASHIVLLLKSKGDTPPPRGTLRRVAEMIVAPQLKQECGVSGVVIRGGQRPQCVVVADPNQLTLFDVTPLELAEVLESKSARPGGAGPPSMNEILETVVAMRGNQPVRLGDLADVRIEMTKPEPAAWRHVSILVTMVPGTSAATLQTRVASLALKLPKNVLLQAAKPTKPMIAVWLSLPKQQQLNALIQRVQALVLKVPGVKSATAHRTDHEPEVVVELKRDLAATLGITDAQVQATIQLALEGRAIGNVLHDKQSVALVVRLEQDRPQGLNEVLNQHIRSKSGDVLTVSSIADVRQTRSPNTIFRLDRRQAGLIRVKTTKDANPERVVEAIRLALAGLHGEIYVALHEYAGGK